MLLEEFIKQLNNYLVGTTKNDSNIIRRHTKKLETLGDLSFPLALKNWHHLLDSCKHESNGTIFDYLHNNRTFDEQLIDLKKESMGWCMEIREVKRIDNDLSIFFNRVHMFEQTIVDESLYNNLQILTHDVHITVDNTIIDKDDTVKDLNELRMCILYKILVNLLKQTTDVNTTGECTIDLTMKPIKNGAHILCGPVLNNEGLKDTATTAKMLFHERKCDMRASAQHRFHVPVKPTDAWDIYFEKLGRAAVTIELLSVKPHKGTKLSVSNSNAANKGPAFIFYNCARLSVLLKEFQKKVDAKIYPHLPNIKDIDFSVLNQPEEWELLYVYILQYPLVLKSCIKDVMKGGFNPQYLVQFLSNLTSLFSVYYRRCRVLVDPREHLFNQIHARIYLLESLEGVFHHALKLLDIEPIKAM